MKNSTLGPGSKMGHFSYLGDAQVGADVNIGAGTITCNFDGEHKHPTVIEEDVFIGSDSMLVAPLHIGRGAKTGAGSVVTHDVPAGAVATGSRRSQARAVGANAEDGLRSKQLWTWMAFADRGLAADQHSSFGGAPGRLCCCSGDGPGFGQPGAIAAGIGYRKSRAKAAETLLTEPARCCRPCWC